MHAGMWPEHTQERRDSYLFVHVRRGESMERDRAVYARASALQVCGAIEAEQERARGVRAIEGRSACGVDTLGRETICVRREVCRAASRQVLTDAVRD